MYMLSGIINDEHIFLSFGKDLHGQSSCHLYMVFQLLPNMASGHVKVKEGTGHVFYTATPSHATESVDWFDNQVGKSLGWGCSLGKCIPLLGRHRETPTLAGTKFPKP